MMSVNASTESNKKSVKHLLLLCFLLLVVLAVMIVIWSQKKNVQQGYDPFETVALVNGEPIAAGELKLFFETKKAGVFDYFYKKYDVEYDEYFWMTEVNGENPIDNAIEMAVEDLTQMKVEQILFREYGMVKDIDYDTFLEELEKENLRRASGTEIIYGPEQYTEELYYNYLQTNRVNELREIIISSGEFALNDEELLEIYNQAEKGFLKSYGDFKIEVFAVSYIGEDALTPEEAKEVIEAVVTDVNAGMTFKEAVEKNKSNSTFMEKEFDSESIRMEENEYNQSFEKEILKMEPDKLCDYFDTGSELVLCMCVEKRPEEYYSFDEMKENLRNLVAVESYEKMIENLTIDADVEILDSAHVQMAYCLQ